MIRGLLLTIGLTLIAYIISAYSGINVILMGLLLGIIIGNLFSFSDKYAPGIKFSAGILLEIAIVLIAFSINYASLIQLGWQTLLILLASVVWVLAITLFLAKKLKCPGTTGWLIGFGTAICGSSAIAALAPQIAKDKSDMGMALAVVNIMGLLGMVLLPYVVPIWLNDADTAILLGSSLHSLGNVAGAGFVINEQVGEMAVTIKMGRIALLAPALFLFQVLIHKQSPSKESSKMKLQWYLIAFIVVSVFVTLVPMPAQFVSGSKWSANAILTVAMAAIGLKMNLSTVAKSGKRGIIFGLLVFVLQLILILFLIWLL